MNLQDLITKAQSLSQVIGEWSNLIVIYFNPNPDATIAGIVFAKVLSDLSVPFVLRSKEEEKLIDEMSNGINVDSHIFIGYSYDTSVLGANRENVWIVEPIDEKDTLERVMNAGDFGYLRPEVTLSALSYFICDSIAQSITYIIQLPLIAAQTGDHYVEYKGLVDLIAQHAQSENIIQISKSLALPATDSYSLSQSILFCHKPFLPSLTGNERNVTKLLGKANIIAETSEGPRKISDLSSEEIADLNSTLIVHLAEFKGYQEDKLVFVKTKTTLLQEQKHSVFSNTWDFAQAILDAFNRKQHDIAISVLLGNRKGKMSELSKIFQEEREALTISFELLLDKQDQITELQNIRYFEAGRSVNWYNASLVAAMVLSNGLVTVDLPFAIIAEGPGSMRTIGIRSSKNQTKSLDLQLEVKKVLTELKIERSLSGSSLSVQVQVPSKDAVSIIEMVNKNIGLMP